MSTASKALRYYLFGEDRRARPRIDPADMGTCFGLEMSFDDTPALAPPVAAAPPVPPLLQRLAARKHAGA